MKIHRHSITKKALAAQLGLTHEYVGKILNGHCDPKGAEQKFSAALDELIAEKSAADNQ